jgi:hypothetical protein
MMYRLPSLNILREGPVFRKAKAARFFHLDYNLSKYGRR